MTCYRVSAQEESRCQIQRPRTGWLARHEEVFEANTATDALTMATLKFEARKHPDGKFTQWIVELAKCPACGGTSC